MWLSSNTPHDHEAYKAFLKDIGYLVEEGDAFEIETSNIDPEIASVPGPQLVVPITNARYALNAANARWGSLYDCLYGTDAMGHQPPKGKYDKGHGARVIARARVSLIAPFQLMAQVTQMLRRYHVQDGQLLIDDCPLSHPEKFAGYTVLRRRQIRYCCATTVLHVALIFDRAHPIGSRDQAFVGRCSN